MEQRFIAKSGSEGLSLTGKVILCDLTCVGSQCHGSYHQQSLRVGHTFVHI